MNIICNGIKNGVIEDKYGKRGTQFNKDGMPSYSLPIKIENSPKGTISYAIIIDDKDAIPVCGFTWIHWLVANLKRNELKENESITAKDFIQGTNSWASSFGGCKVENCNCYGGMTPPDAPHTYTIHVYALDTILNLNNGFYVDDLHKAIKGHILDYAYIEGIYSN
ncbi:YbhB/YbcL family Raf kinase inhibitor-like protein [Clostridium tarantellae]|uniref:YbhB/YbcL family Raf kinase inhibitor-like protein n=1 Tax=Clostridium tarantellae TaxID=39493 RepID=A0A6I1MQ59_9CLOT|nr:YbhB/YbcL family Raf kinase inhibitor-like protein [Clostridium tarantellae]MPQ44953.1 YbhB/YbcL family Raf kinase inhibitor-like protein [Clostridium tarantellae]